MLRSVGAIIFGIAGDRYGRKWPFIVNNLLFIVLELGTGFCRTYGEFLAVRSLFGIAMGGLYGNAAATALEDCPTVSYLGREKKDTVAIEIDAWFIGSARTHFWHVSTRLCLRISAGYRLRKSTGRNYSPRMETVLYEIVFPLLLRNTRLTSHRLVRCYSACSGYHLSTLPAGNAGLSATQTCSRAETKHLQSLHR
jgi:hypothetical protein